MASIITIFTCIFTTRVAKVMHVGETSIENVCICKVI